VWPAWPALPGDALPRHREKHGTARCEPHVTEDVPEVTRPATVLDAAHAYVAEADAYAVNYRFLAATMRRAIADPIRGEHPGDVEDVIHWDDRAAVWAQRALWVRAAIGGGP
jgi:hypothetical protein